MAAPMSWRRLVCSVYAPAVSGLITRMSDRFFRTRDRRQGSSVLLLAPLLAEADPLSTTSQPRSPVTAGTEGLHHRFRWIADHVPAFCIPGHRVRVLRTPDEFFQVMKARIRTAKKRVVMASLYLGTGPLEQELSGAMWAFKWASNAGLPNLNLSKDAILTETKCACAGVDCIEEALVRSRKESLTSDFKVSILLDYTRGSRGKRNSRTMLLPLLKGFPGQLRVALYHTPDLRGLLRLLVPERFNETIGVQHIKAYLFDDDLLISGANLSDSYFTNRQDRYVLLQGCREVADFFAELVGAVADSSLQLQPDDGVRMQEGRVHPYKGRWRDRTEFAAAARQRVMGVVNSARARQRLEVTAAQEGEGAGEGTAAGPGREDTWVFPLVQMKPLGISLDEQVTKRLLTEAGGDCRIYLTSGYFNLTRAYVQLLLSAAADYRILLASPEVNGFFGAKGVAGSIPAAYVHIARQFYSRVCRLGQQERIRLHEYHQRNWTFHAKVPFSKELISYPTLTTETFPQSQPPSSSATSPMGWFFHSQRGLWYYLQGSDKPCLTLIGSPNFGYRSVHRDLEAQIAIVTENKELQAQLQQEQEMLYQRSTEVSSSTFEQPNRYVKLWVKLVTPFIKNFF
ncbi:PGPS1 protein, partial [Atractosteus spatula]|nr:PGPS1 protein [Atractosteus spatula]